MKWLIFLLLCFSVVQAQTMDNSLFKKLDKTKLQFTDSENERISHDLKGQFIKKEYDIVEIPDAVKNKNISELKLAMEENKEIVLPLKYQNTDQLGSINQVFQKDASNYVIITTRGDNIYAFIQTNKGIYKLTPISKQYHLLKKIDLFPKKWTQNS